MIRPIFAAIGLGLCLTGTAPAFAEAPKICTTKVCASWAWIGYNGQKTYKCERYETRIMSKCGAAVPNSDFDWGPRRSDDPASGDKS